MEKQWYSNCLLEAVKAKIKNPKKVKILNIPRKITKEIVPHFMWTDGMFEYAFDSSKDLKWYEMYLYKGQIYKYRLGTVKKYVCSNRPEPSKESD